MQARLIKQEAERCFDEYQNYFTTLSDHDVSILANRAVSLFFDYYHVTGAPLRLAVELLCEINFSRISSHAAIGLNALFPNLIERLNDSFLPAYCNLYDRVFAQVISFCRRLSDGSEIDQALHHFGLHSEAHILRRKRNLQRHKNVLLLTRPLKKILFLSRVTIGADVAVTSVLIAHLKKLYPNAEMVFVGSNKLSQLYGGDPCIRIRQIDYGRSSNLLYRLQTWLTLIQTIEVETSGLNPEHYCVIDPDSRLTQLGLLPIFPKFQDHYCYFHFPSRSYSHPEKPKIAQLAGQWIGHISHQHEDALPFVNLPIQQLSLHQKIKFQSQESEQLPVICLSFGVGGNNAKRVSLDFEVQLVFALSVRAKLIIDYGATLAEREQINSILTVLAQNGKIINSIWEESQYSDVLTLQGDIGEFASIIAKSDLYIGYDSAGQHIAAALQVPTLTIFVNSGTGFFRDRWQPHGATRIKTIYFDNIDQKNQLSQEDLLGNILKAQEQLLCI